MDDVGSHDMLAQLVALGTSSLLQYVGESGSWAAPGAAGTRSAILALAQEERDATTRFMRFLQKKHIRLPPLGAYPSHFTTMNFVDVDFLTPKLVREHVKEQGAIERLLVRIDDEEIRTMVQGYLDMKRRHLETLEDLARPKAIASV
jgi:hypothetical protein